MTVTRRSWLRWAATARASTAPMRDRLRAEESFAKGPTTRVMRRGFLTGGFFAGGGGETAAATNVTCVAVEETAANVPSLAFVAMTVHDPAASAARTSDDDRVHTADPAAVT